MSQRGTKMARFVKRVAALGLAGCMLLGISSEASAAALKDVFDEQYYADSYEDLKAIYGYDREALWNHFITVGVKEGRNMNQFLDIAKYKAQYPDLAAAFGDNWEAYLTHYLTYGAKEKRFTGTGFDALDYAERYPDLKEVFGDDVVALWKHYQEYGSKEDRDARSEVFVEAEKAAEEAAKRAASAAKPESGKEGYSKRVDYQNGVYSINEYSADDLLLKYTYYDKDGKSGNYTELEYDDKKHNVKTKYYDADGALTGWTDNEAFNEAGKVLKSTYYDGKGNVTGKSTSEYDKDGNLTKYTNIFWNDAGEEWVNEHIYTASDHTLVGYKAGAYNTRSETVWDKEGNRVKSVHHNEDGTWSEALFDKSGNQTGGINYDANGKVIDVWEYDENGKVVSKS